MPCKKISIEHLSEQARVARDQDSRTVLIDLRNQTKFELESDQYSVEFDNEKYYPLGGGDIIGIVAASIPQKRFKSEPSWI